MKVPFLDLKTQHATIRDEIAAAMEEVIDTTSFAGGPQVKRFEDNFAKYCECEHAIGVGSGTDALWMALLGLGIGEGDEVIISRNFRSNGGGRHLLRCYSRLCRYRAGNV